MKVEEEIEWERGKVGWWSRSQTEMIIGGKEKGEKDSRGIKRLPS